MRGRAMIALAGAVAVAGATAAVGQSDPKQVGRIGPDSRIQPSGRKLGPVGRLTALGNHPGGGTLTTNGRFLWAISSGRGRNDIRIVRVDPGPNCKGGPRFKACKKSRSKRLGKVVQVIPMPGATGGIAMAPDGRTAYVSGSPESPHKDQQSPKDTPGKDGDVIHVFRYDGATGTAARDGVIDVPPPGDAPMVQDFPPGNAHRSWPRDLAVSPDGKTLLAALNLANYAAVVDTATREASFVKVGSYPYGAGITRDGKYGLVSNEADGTVSVIDLAAKAKVKDITVGPHLSHPEGIATDPKSNRAYVAVTHQDVVAVIDTAKLEVDRTLSVERPEGIGTAPVDVSVTDDGTRLMVANSGEDAIAVFGLPQVGTTAASKKKPPVKKPNAFKLIGRIPVGSYPVAVDTSPGSKRLVWVASKGLGVGPNANGPNPLSSKDSDDEINSFQYLPSIVSGTSGILSFPDDKRIRKYTPAASAQIRPTNAQTPPAGTPLSPDAGKIKHVFYIVRENRTYDQVLGDDPRGDGDPKLTLFPESITPNAHALAKRFPLLDHVYANSEASIDGHFWTSASMVSDYVTKNWHQNYGGRKRPYDFGVYSITWPAQRFLFDKAETQGITYFNYGEAIAGTVPLTDRDRTPDENQQVATKFSNSDLGTPAPAECYPNDASIGTDAITRVETWDSTPPPGAPAGSTSRFDCFKQKFQLQLAAGNVPALNYLVLPSDHTQILSPGRRTVNAMIAENDYALGQIVDLISHSSVWGSSLILVVEDDSQDGADHVDAHRIPAFAISPFAKRGAVVHTRYDFPSFFRTLELPLGMSPLNLNDSLGVPMYDAFERSAQNTEAYSVIPPTVDINARNPTTAAAGRAMRGLNLNQLDRIPQRTMDRLLWKAVHGMGAEAPPPGPNASGLDEAEAEAAGGG